MTKSRTVDVADIKMAVKNRELKAYLKNDPKGTHILLKNTESGETVQIGFVPKKIRYK